MRKEKFLKIGFILLIITVIYISCSEENEIINSSCTCTTTTTLDDVIISTTSLTTEIRGGDCSVGNTTAVAGNGVVKTICEQTMKLPTTKN